MTHQSFNKCRKISLKSDLQTKWIVAFHIDLMAIIQANGLCVWRTHWIILNKNRWMFTQETLTETKNRREYKLVNDWIWPQSEWTLHRSWFEKLTRVVKFSLLLLGINGVDTKEWVLCWEFPHSLFIYADSKDFQILFVYLKHRTSIMTCSTLFDYLHWLVVLNLMSAFITVIGQTAFTLSLVV